MKAIPIPIGMRLARRAIVGATIFFVTLLTGIQLARAAEIVPSIGLQHAKNSSDTKTYGSLAVRGNLLPALQSEIQVSYRAEDQMSDQLKVKMWPISASLWVTPVPALYAGGGVGWYHTTLDYSSALPIADETREEFGVHLGGGLKVPISPAAALDLGGRYVMMREQESQLVPQHFDPDFWTTSLGLAIKF
jgi:hypothetical protein